MVSRKPRNVDLSANETGACYNVACLRSLLSVSRGRLDFLSAIVDSKISRTRNRFFPERLGKGSSEIQRDLSSFPAQFEREYARFVARSRKWPSIFRAFAESCARSIGNHHKSSLLPVSPPPTLRRTRREPSCFFPPSSHPLCPSSLSLSPRRSSRCRRASLSQSYSCFLVERFSSK